MRSIFISYYDRRMPSAEAFAALALTPLGLRTDTWSYEVISELFSDKLKKLSRKLLLWPPNTFGDLDDSHAIFGRVLKPQGRRIVDFVGPIEPIAEDLLSQLDTRKDRHLLSPRKAARIQEAMRLQDVWVAAIIRALWATPGKKEAPRPLAIPVADLAAWDSLRVWDHFNRKAIVDRAARTAARLVCLKVYRRPILYSALAILAASRANLDRYFSSLSWTQRARRLVTRGGALLIATLEPTGDFARTRFEEVAAS